MFTITLQVSCDKCESTATTIEKDIVGHEHPWGINVIPPRGWSILETIVLCPFHSREQKQASEEKAQASTAEEVL